MCSFFFFFFFQAEDGIRDYKVTGVQTCALPILAAENAASTGIRLAVDPVPATADAPGTNGDAAKKTRRERSRELEAIAARREADKKNNPPLNPTNTGNKVWVMLAVVCLLGALVGWWRYSHPVREAV